MHCFRFDLAETLYNDILKEDETNSVIFYVFNLLYIIYY